MFNHMIQHDFACAGPEAAGRFLADRSSTPSIRGRRNQAGRFAWGFLLMVEWFMAPCAFPHDIPLTGPIPPEVHSIELTYADAQTIPTVTLLGRPNDAGSPPHRPVAPMLDLLPMLEEARVFGSCDGRLLRDAKESRTVRAELSGGHGARCGLQIDLRPNGGTLDILSYATLRLRGQATGSLVMAFEDRDARVKEGNVPVATVSGPFDVVIPLRQVARALDLRQVTALVVRTEGGDATMTLQQVEVALDSRPRTQGTRTGIWIWNVREVLDDPELPLRICRRVGCSKVLVQMPALSDEAQLWAAYVRFFARAQEAGIEAIALDGYPEAIQDPRPLADKIRQLLRLMEPRTLAGVQLDIEPYLLPGFLANERGPRQFLEAIELMREAVDGRTRLSMVIPFWLTSITVNGRPLAFAVMDRADEVAVMSYRTDLEAVRRIADDTLRYGDAIGTPVWLALETTRLPVEHRVVLTRDSRLQLADAILDRARGRVLLSPFPSQLPDDAHEGFRIHHRYTVRPEGLTFAGRSLAEVRTAVGHLLERVPNPSFAGVLLHDLSGIRALTE